MKPHLVNQEQPTDGGQAVAGEPRKTQCDKALRLPFEQLCFELMMQGAIWRATFYARICFHT